MEEVDAEFENLPDHRLPHLIILNNILSRLPVKSLLRSKCVCKQWRHSISTPQFIKLHLTQSQDTTTSHRVAVLESRHPPPVSIALRSIDLETHSDGALIELHNTFKYSYPNAKVLSSCNGLILIGISEKTYIVWNPSTREYEHLACLPCCHNKVYILTGLGYDRLVDEYKVVMACRVIDTASDRESVLMYFYSSKTTVGSRDIKLEFPYKISKDTSGTVVNGVPHWLLNRDRDEGEEGFPVIIYFDFVAEVFVELTQPSYGYESSDISKFDLGVLGGCLSIVCHREHYVEVLALKRYRVIESWTKLFVIHYDTESLSFKTLTPLCFTKNGEVLMEIDRKRLVVYNIEEKLCRFIGFSHNDNGFKVVMYVESLVSPHGGASRSRSKPYWNMAITGSRSSSKSKGSKSKSSSTSKKCKSRSSTSKSKAT